MRMATLGVGVSHSMESNAELERQFYEEDFGEDDEDDYRTKQPPTISPVSLPVSLPAAAASPAAPNRSRSRSGSLLHFFSLSSSPLRSPSNPDILPKTRASSSAFNTCTSSDGEPRTSLLKLASFSLGSSPMRSPSELFATRPSQSSLSSSPPEFGIEDKHHRIKLKFENKRDRL